MWIQVIAIAGIGLAAVLLLYHHYRFKPLTIQGAVIRQGAQPDKELPLADVEITARNGIEATSCKSDSSGFFKLTLPASWIPSEPVTIRFRRHGYQPLDVSLAARDKLHVVKMVPRAPERETRSRRPQVRISNISVRYSVKTTTPVNVGSTVKTFQVVNTGNVPCKHQKPCSPDGKWKAATGSISLDAGDGNVFHNTRVSCIAGPCPFTRVMSHSLSNGGRTLSVTALNWSDTTTFLIEAEVVHPMASAEVRKSYPVIFGRALDFTVPESAEGVCIAADIGGDPIIFPLGPTPVLRWADCQARVGQNQTKAYRCELKDGYRF